jgi:hypothetical protein
MIVVDCVAIGNNVLLCRRLVFRDRSYRMFNVLRNL